MNALLSSIGNVWTTSSSNVIKNGLKVYLDAGNRQSYRGTGSTWYDLSGNGNNGTLVNSPTFYTYDTAPDKVPSIGFNGTNQRVSFSYQTPTQTASTAFTWTLWYRALRNLDSDVVMGYRGTTPLKFYKLTTQKFEMYPAEVYGPSLLNGWRMMTAVYDGTLGNPGNMKIYHGSQYSSTYASGTLDNNAPNFPIELRDGDTPDLLASAMPFYVGGDPIGGEYFNGFIGGVLIYDRALTASEIAMNYDSITKRYPWGFQHGYTAAGTITESPTKTFTTTTATAWSSTQQIYSSKSYTNTAFVSAFYRGISGSQAMLGLNSDPTTDSNYTSLDYAWYFNGSGQVGIWESNTQVVAPSSIGYNTSGNDNFSIEFNGTSVLYKKNGSTQRTVARGVGSALFLDTAFNSSSGAVKFIDLRFGGT
jgi:hypothetical protein